MLYSTQRYLEEGAGIAHCDVRIDGSLAQERDPKFLHRRLPLARCQQLLASLFHFLKLRQPFSWHLLCSDTMIAIAMESSSGSDRRITQSAKRVRLRHCCSKHSQEQSWLWTIHHRECEIVGNLSTPKLHTRFSMNAHKVATQAPRRALFVACLSQSKNQSEKHSCPITTAGMGCGASTSSKPLSTEQKAERAKKWLANPDNDRTTKYGRQFLPEELQDEQFPLREKAEEIFILADKDGDGRLDLVEVRLRRLNLSAILSRVANR